MGWLDDVRHWARSKMGLEAAYPDEPPPPAPAEESSVDLEVGPPDWHEGPSDERPWGARGDVFSKNLKAGSLPPDSAVAPELPTDVPVKEPTGEELGALGIGGPAEESEPPAGAQLPAPPPAAPPATSPPEFATPALPQPKDESNKWLALRQMVSGGGALKPLLGIEPDTTYEDAQIAKEIAKQKDWKAAVANQLKQKFEWDRQGRDISSREGIAKANQDAQNARFDLARGDRQAALKQAQANQDRVDARVREEQKRRDSDRDEARVERAGSQAGQLFKQGAMPSPALISYTKNVERILDTKGVPKAMGAVLRSISNLTPDKWTGAVENLISHGLSGEEQEEFRQFWGLGMKAAFEDAGKNFTGTEKSVVTIMNGLAGQSPEAVEGAMRQLIADIRERGARIYGASGPVLQKQLRAGIENGRLTLEDYGIVVPDEELTPER